MLLKYLKYDGDFSLKKKKKFPTAVANDERRKRKGDVIKVINLSNFGSFQIYISRTILKTCAPVFDRRVTAYTRNGCVFATLARGRRRRQTVLPTIIFAGARPAPQQAQQRTDSAVSGRFVDGCYDLHARSPSS